MPINEFESHPYLELGEAIRASRMIIGTFPIYSLTMPRTPHKIALQNQRGDTSFFYGSNANLFWSWYKEYIDATVNISDPQSIMSSLRNKKVAISDVIKGCTRIEESFKDNGLRQKVWNSALAGIIYHRIEKIVCTSKSDSGAMGWLRDKILLPAGFSVNAAATAQLHIDILAVIPDSNTNIKHIAQVLEKDDKTVHLVALPSPGSPERQLINFGYIKGVHTTTAYLKNYLTQTFQWFQL